MTVNYTIFLDLYSMIYTVYILCKRLRRQSSNSGARDTGALYAIPTYRLLANKDRQCFMYIYI